jgi:putative DNA primase/helicase
MSARTVTAALKGKWHGRYGTARCPCHDDHTPSLKIKDDPTKSDGIDVIDFGGCHWRDVKAELARQGLIDEGPNQKTHPRVFSETRSKKIAEADRDDENRRVDYALVLWEQSVPLGGTLGWRYFTERRGLHIGLLDDLSHCLRWHDRERMIVALMTHPITNTPTGVHRTFLNPDATKRDRKMIGVRNIIRLSPDESVTTGLGLCEGVEDGLAILLSGWAPVWCATCAGAIKSFPVLSGIESLTIFADTDPVGRRRHVRVPKHGGQSNVRFQ